VRRFSLKKIGFLRLTTAAHLLLWQLFQVDTIQAAELEHTESTKSVFAKRITQANASTLIRSGPDAIGGIDDWFISNGTICAIVSDVNHEGEFSDKGGSLVDLGFCGRADDHYSFSHDLLQGSRRRPLDSHKIWLEQGEEQASIVVTGYRDGAHIQTRYTLRSDTPTQLSIKKQLWQDQHNPETEEFNFLSILNFNYHSLEPFVFASKDLNNTNGFQNEDFVTRGESALTVAARNADTIITISPPTAQHGISYGWHLKSAERVEDDKRYTLPSFILADDASNVILVLSDTFYLGDGSSIGWLQLPQILLLNLDNAKLETEEIIFVGKNGDVASVTDQFFVNQAVISGNVNETDVAIHIRQRDGTPVTHIRPDNNGYFSARLPKGNYQLHIKGSASRVLEKDFSLNTATLSFGQLTMPTPARVNLPTGNAMRLVFLGINGTESPNFTDTLTGFSVHHGDDKVVVKEPVSQIFLAGVEGDVNSVELAPGDYRIYATRGPEFSVEQTQIKVLPGSKTELTIGTPTRQLSTPGYIASDLHVHSGLSFDNSFSVTERVRTFIAEHGEVMVSSEHDIPVDFRPSIAQMGVEDKIIAIAAAEITSLLPTTLNPYSGGHINAFPYSPDKHAFRRGMLNHENRRWRDIFHDLKNQQGEIITQLNHPRSDMRLSGEKLPHDWAEIIDYGHYLDHMGSAGHPYNPHKPLHEHPNSVLIEADKETGLRDIDFDLIEIVNPGGEDHNERIDAVRLDWLSMLKQGEKLVGTANSDSHGSDHQVAVPRTMVAIQDDRISAFAQTEFLTSLKNGNAYGTTGPMLEISLGGKLMGETFQGNKGLLKVKIFSADWIEVNTLEIQVNGDTIKQIALTQKNSQTISVPMTFTHDSFITIEASGPATQVYSAIYPEISPYVFTNPIYVDYDSDGKWVPPGL